MVNATPRQRLPLGMTRCPLLSAVGGSQGRSGRVQKISPLPGFDPPDRPAHSESLSQSARDIDVTAHTHTHTDSHSYRNNGCTAGGVESCLVSLALFRPKCDYQHAFCKCYVSSVVTKNEYIFIRF